MSEERILPSQMESSVYIRQNMTLTLKHGQTVEALLDPTIWANIARKLHPRDKVEVLSQDNSVYAELLVVDSSDLWVKAKVIHKVEFDDVKQEDDGSGLYVKWMGGAKWAVLRQSDDSYISRDHVTREEAEIKKVNYQRTIAA